MTDERNLAIRVMLLPKDTYSHGTIFGGVILSHLDLAAAVEASRHTRHRMVTVAMKEVQFHEPVYVGDTVSFYTRLKKIGTTSITVFVDVEAQRGNDRDSLVRVTEAEVTYVAVDENGEKTAVQ